MENYTEISGGSMISHGGGGCGSHRGTRTPEVVTFQKFCMSKRKEAGPLGGGMGRARPPLDPPIQTYILFRRIIC